MYLANGTAFISISRLIETRLSRLILKRYVPKTFSISHNGFSNSLITFADNFNAVPNSARVRIGSFCVALDRSLTLPFASAFSPNSMHHHRIVILIQNF